MVQSEFVQNKNQIDNSMFASSSLLVEGEDIWFLTSQTDVLIRFRISDMELMEYYIVPAEYLQKDIHVRLENANNGIYIVPYRGEGLFYFDKKTKTMKEISTSIFKQGFAEKRRFRITAFWKGHLFLVGHDISCIYDLEEETGHVSEIKTYLDVLHTAGAETRGAIFSDCFYQYGSMLYIPLVNQSYILCMNLEDRSFYAFQLSERKKIRLCTIDKYGEEGKFLLTTLDDEKIIWSPKNGLEEWEKLGVLRKEKMYLRAYHVNNKNYYIPAKERKIYVEKEGIIRILPFVYPLNTKYPEYDTFQYEVVDKFSNIIYFQIRDGHLFYIDTVKDEIHNMNFSVSNDTMREIKKHVLGVRNIPKTVDERYCFHLGDYLEMVVRER